MLPVGGQKLPVAMHDAAGMRGTGAHFRWSNGFHWIIGLVMIVFFASAAGVSATSILAPDFPRLVKQSELIFTGRVLDQRSTWKNLHGTRSIVTSITFAVDQVHKGRAGATMVLEFLGGTVGDVTLEVDSMPRFRQGERVVLFVERGTGHISPLVGLCHGKFSMRHDTAAGEEIVCAHDGHPVSDVREIGRPRAPRAVKREQPALTHEAFAARIRAAASQP